MDGLCRAKGRLGKPSDQSAGSPPLMYATLRYQNNLERVCEAAERGVLPRVYPPPVQLGIHVRAQLSVPCPNLDAAARQLGTNDVFIETKFDGFRFQLHWHGRDRQMRCFYRSGVECTADVGDLLPAVELALGGDPEQVLRRDATDEATRLRFTWLEKAWAKVTPEQRAAFTHNTADLVLDGELLVYDESMTPKGLYDELGTRSGIAAFGTNFWVRQTADGKPSGYSREDARRHYLVKVFDVLRYNGEEILRRPLHERRELLESGRCFIALPHYLELTQSDCVDLASPEGPLQAAFDEARAAQAEGLMVKAAHQPYVPNGRINVLKCKVEFIPGLGDTVTLLLLGARVPRTLGAGDEASMLVEFAIGARESDAAAAPLVWLFNTSALPWRGSSLTQPMLKRLYLCLTEGWGHRPALMNRLGVDEPPPAWMRQCPTSTMARPHWVLLDPESAPVVEVMGSRFLRRYNQDKDASSNRSLPWTIRFPRVARWFEETDGVVVDTVASFRAKAVAAFSSSGPQDDDDDGAEEEAPAEPLVPLKPVTWHLAPPSVPVEMPETSRWQAELRDAAPPTPASSSSSMPSMRSPRGPAARRSGYPGDAASKAKQQPFTEVPPTTTLLDVDEATRQLHKAKTAIVQCSDGTLYYLRGIDAGGAVVQPLHDGGERTHPLSRLRQLTGYDSDEVGLLDDPRVSLAKRQRRGA